MKKIKFILLIYFSLITLQTALSQNSRIIYEEYDLDNGLHVILHEDNTTPIVAVSVMYNVGSKHENPDRTGFAHFFEHLMFEGTENIERGEYGKLIENAGGTLNANTSADRTYYYQILPSNQLELGLWMEAERMMHAKVDSVGIQTQKQVVIEEKKQSYDNRPYGTFLIETLKRAFTEHPYSWPTIGDPEHIMAAKDEEFQEFYDTFYVPNNAVLVVAGDINKEEAKKWIEKYYSTIPTGKKEIRRPQIIEPPLKAEVRDTIFDNIQVPLILQAYRTPEMNTKDFFAIEMLSALLSGGESSRLHKSLVDRQEVSISVSSIPLPFNEPSLNFILAFANMGVDPQEVENAINSEIIKVREELVSEREFQKLRNQFENSVVSNNEKIAERAENLATYYTYYKNTELINNQMDNYMSITREDIQRVAKQYFKADNRVVLYYLPHQN